MSITITKDDIFELTLVLISLGATIGIIDGVLEDIMLEAFLWCGVFFFHIILMFYIIFDNIKVATGLTLVLSGSFVGVMQTVFFFVYGIMRQFPQGPLEGKIWIIPGVVWTVNQFVISIALGYAMIIIGYVLLKSVFGSICKWWKK